MLRELLYVSLCVGRECCVFKDMWVYVYTPTCTFMSLAAASQSPAKPSWDLQPPLSSRLLDGNFHSHMVV